MKISTGTGDRGRTSLYSGERVPKDHARIEAVGALDELNAALGALRASLPAVAAPFDPEIEDLQKTLFAVGAHAAVLSGAEAAALPAVDPAVVGRLEAAIDRLEAELPALTGFILPAGGPAAAHAHLARTVCRRAERRIVALAATDAYAPPPAALAFMNRLSDFLFVLARTLARLEGQPERLWTP